MSNDDSNNNNGIFDSICDIPECIQELYKDSVVRLNPNIEGQRIEKNVMYLGTRSGPSSNIDALLHEMCHFTEIDEPRMFTEGWGFYYGKWFEHITRYSPGFYEYFGTKDIEREERVVAWQANAAEYLGIKHDLKGYINSFQFLPGFSNLSSQSFKGKVGGERYTKEKRINFIRKRITALRKEEPRFSGENFINEWYRRNNILRAATEAEEKKPHLTQK
jgi:hypothetical protein